MSRDSFTLSESSVTTGTPTEPAVPVGGGGADRAGLTTTFEAWTCAGEVGGDEAKSLSRLRGESMLFRLTPAATSCRGEEGIEPRRSRAGDSGLAGGEGAREDECEPVFL